MDKLKLDLAGLEVQSFATGGNANRSGTVRAHDSVGPTQIDCPTVEGCTTGIGEYTCEAGCYVGSGQPDTCVNSCDCYSAGCGGSDGCMPNHVTLTYYASMCPR